MCLNIFKYILWISGCWGGGGGGGGGKKKRGKNTRFFSQQQHSTVRRERDTSTSKSIRNTQHSLREKREWKSDIFIIENFSDTSIYSTILFLSKQDAEEDEEKAKYIDEFFKLTDPRDATKKICDLCKKSKDAKMFSNLFSHLTSCHSTQYEAAYKDRHPEINSQRNIRDIYGGSNDAQRLWFWIRKVVLIPLPFTTVESEVMREGCK